MTSYQFPQRLSFPFSGGGGASLKTRTPADIFVGANRNAAETARNNGLDAAAIAEFDADPNLLIILRIAASDTFQARRTGAWRDVTNIVEGARGPGPTDQQVTAAVQAGVKAYARVGGPLVPEAEIDPSILRDAEVTRAFLLNILSLTAQQVNDLFTGAVVSGAGEARIITVTQTDGSTIVLAVPDTTGGGGGEGTADGRVASGAFSGDGATLTLTLTTRGTIDISVPQLLRQAGLSQSQVQALIDASLRESVVIASSNTQIPATADGDTYVHTGSSDITYTLPRASGQGAVRDGFEVVVTNQGSGDLTIDGFGADTINSSASLLIDEIHRSVRLQKIANSAWAVISDTKDDTASGDGGADQTARDAAAAAQRAAESAAAAAATADGKAVVAQSTADAANTLTRKIALLSLYVDPGVKAQQAPATRVNAITGNYRLLITPPDVLAGEDVWVRIFGRGRPLNAGRVKIDVSPAPQFPVNFTIDQTTATNINDNDAGGDTIDIEAHFYSSDADAGLFEVRTIPVEIVQTPRVDDRQPLLPNLGNDQVWISRGRGVVAEAIGTIATPVLIVSNIASFDAAQNRFEDSSGNEVVVPNGAIVTLTQAVYDAAVADAQFTPNANAIFLTR